MHGTWLRRNVSNFFLLALCLVCAVSPTQAQDARVSTPAGGYTIYVVPHSHMDLEWMWTYEQGEAFSIRILNQALRMLKMDPRFTFTQDQLRALQPFWDSLSLEDKAFLRRMIKEGRFEVATGMLVQPDVNEADFESLTRQLLVAKPWMEQTLGATIVTGWNIDTFGHSLQIPQLFRGGGLRYAFFSRAFPPETAGATRNLFYWRSPDGSTVLTHVVHYRLGTLLDFKELDQDGQPLGKKGFEDLIRRNPPGNAKIMIPWGTDEYLPIESSSDIKAQVAQAAAHLGIPVKTILLSTASHYFRDVEQSGVTLPTYGYDFNPPVNVGAWEEDIRGIWAERPAQKMAERRAEDMLESAEKLSTIEALYGQPYPQHDLDWGWMRLLANQVHDTMGGSIADAPYEVAMSRYGGAIEAGRQAEVTALFRLSRQIDTAGSGDFPIVVFNALSFARTEVIRCSPTFLQETFIEGPSINKVMHNFRLLDAAGNSIPFRLLTVSGEDSGVRMAQIEFVAEQVPALGYRVYRIEPAEGNIQLPQWQVAQGEVSNRFFRSLIDPSTGSMSMLTDRQTGEEFLESSHYGGNELVLEEEKDPDLEGPVHFTGGEVRGSEFPPDSVVELTDELGTTIKIDGPFMGGRRTQEIRLYNQLPRVDFRTELREFPGHDGMLAVMFPLRRPPKWEARYETHNAVTRRPDGIYDAHTWVNIGDSRSGFALINRGTGAHQIDAGNLRLMLLRSVTHYRRYHAPAASEAGTHVFEYSVYPHAGDWSSSGVADQAHSINSPLRVILTDSHKGRLPPEHSFLSIKEGHFEITALKKAQRGNDLILRGHETLGKAGHPRLHVEFPIKHAWLADLLEQRGKEVPVHQGDIEFDCRPFQFVTLRLSEK